MSRSSLRQGLARLPQPLDVQLALLRELVDEPHGDSRLAERLDLVRFLGASLRLQLLRQLVAGGRELGEGKAVELIDFRIPGRHRLRLRGALRSARPWTSWSARRPSLCARAPRARS